MRIYNTNFTTPPYQAGKKTGFPLFHEQVRSLYDGLTGYNPDWDIINSLTNGRHQEGLSTDLTQIPSPMTPFKRTITLKIQNDTLLVDLFDVTELEYLQGFYNDSVNNTGVLVYRQVTNNYGDSYISQTTATGDYNEILSIAQMVTPIDTNVPAFIHNINNSSFYITVLNDDTAFRNALNSCVIWGTIDVATCASTEDLEQALGCNFLNSHFFYIFVPAPSSGDTYLTCYRGNIKETPYYGVNGTILEDLQLYYNESEGYGEIWDANLDPEHTPTPPIISKVTLDNISSLPTGYTCIAKGQPTGRDATSNVQHYNLKNYYIGPLGNGGFYLTQTDGNQIIATYTPNDYEQFVNKTYLNLFAGVARYYILNSQSNIVFGQAAKTCNSYSILVSVYNNMDILQTNYGLGEQTLVPYTYIQEEDTDHIISVEEVFFDSNGRYDAEAVNDTGVSTFTYFLNTPNAFNNLKLGVF